MQLVLLRHADANTSADVDTERRLSEKGEEQALKVAQFCERQEIKPEIIITSPVRRAVETAEIVSKELKVDFLVEDWLACGMHPHAAMDGLKAYRRHECVMIVGHEPDFSHLVSWLVGIPDNSNIHIRKASLTHVEVQSHREAGGRLEFSIPCRLM